MLIRDAPLGIFFSLLRNEWEGCRHIPGLPGHDLQPSAVCCYIETFTISNTLGNMPLSFGFLVPFNYQSFLLCLQPYLSWSPSLLMLRVIALLIHSQSVNWTFGLSLEEGELDGGSALEENLGSIESQWSLTSTFLSTEWSCCGLWAATASPGYNRLMASISRQRAARKQNGAFKLN